MKTQSGDTESKKLLQETAAMCRLSPKKLDRLLKDNGLTITRYTEIISAALKESGYPHPMS